MSVNDKLAEFRTVLGEENAEDRQAKGGRLLKEIEQLVKDLEDDKAIAVKESVKRKGVIRDLNSDIETKDEKIETLENKIKKMGEDSTVTDLEEKNVKLKAQVDEFNKLRRSDFVNSFKSISEHSDFEKIKDKLKSIPEPENGEVDWKDVSEEDIFANQDVIQEAKGYGLFGDLKETPSTSKADSKTPVGEAGKGYFKKMEKHYKG